jgi:hypothetical protein
VFALVLLGLMGAQIAQAQSNRDYPNKAITMIVPFRLAALLMPLPESLLRKCQLI